MPDKVRPFYCGTQMSNWTNKNCEHCRKASRESQPETCDIETTIWTAYAGSGFVPLEVARRMGYDGAHYCWPCGEIESTTPEHAAEVAKWRTAGGAA